MGYHLAAGAPVGDLSRPRLFAPVAARIARGEEPPGELRDAQARVDRGWARDYARIIYLDHFGNAITGIRAEGVEQERRLGVGTRVLPAARTYSEVAPGAAFWYANANGLVEIAVNRGNAAATSASGWAIRWRGAEKKTD